MQKSARLLLALLLLALAAILTQAVDVPSILKSSSQAILEPTSRWDTVYTFKVWKLDFRFRPTDFRVEAVLLSFSIFYLIANFLGKTRNQALANEWTKVARALLQDEFAHIEKIEEAQGQHVAPPDGHIRILWNGSADALVYASGRRGVECLQIQMTFIPYHDPIQLLYNFMSDIGTSAIISSSRDTLTYNFSLPYQAPDNVSGVFALVDKTFLRSTKKGRFDLTFAKVIDSENANEQRNLSNQFAMLSEVGELMDTILGEIGEKGNHQRHRVGLQSALNSNAGKLLQSLTLTDQPAKRPEEGAIPVAKRQRNLILVLRMPKNAQEAKDSLALLEAACNVIDALEMGHAKLTNTTMAKLRNTRSTVDKELEEEATKWQKEEEEEAKQEAKKKAEQDKLNKLSPAEQEKRKQLEKKRQQRKAQGKASKSR